MIFKNKLKKQMAWVDVASEVGLQNDKCCDKKGKSCLFRKISGTHKRLSLDLLFLRIRRLRLIRRRPRKRKNNNTNTSWNTRLRLRIALCLRLRWTCELPCACVCVCVARVNQPIESTLLRQKLHYKHQRQIFQHSVRNFISLCGHVISFI